MMYKTEIIMPKDILLASHDILVGLATNDDKKDLIRSYFAVNIKYKTFVMYWQGFYIAKHYVNIYL